MPLGKCESQRLCVEHIIGQLDSSALLQMPLRPTITSMKEHGTEST